MKVLYIFVVLMGILTAAEANTRAPTPNAFIWWELKTVNTGAFDAGARGGRGGEASSELALVLHRGNFPSATAGGSTPESIAGETEVWIRNPDGQVRRVETPAEANSVSLHLPTDLNPGDLTGNYLVAAHLDAGVMDMDGDGTGERVHLYSKCLLNYSKTDGSKGKTPDTFFRDGDTLALELGPIQEKTLFPFINSGTSRKFRGKGIAQETVSDGGALSPLAECRINLLYEGAPLADAEVFVLSQSGWRKRILTDALGSLLIPLPNTFERTSTSTAIDRSQSTGRSAAPQTDVRAADKKTVPSAARSGDDGTESPGGQQRRGVPRNDGQAEKTKAGRSEATPADARTENKGAKTTSSTRVSLQTAEDKLLFWAAYRDPSTGEYHCTTLPMSLKSPRKTRAKTDIAGRTGGYILWGIVVVSLGVMGLGSAACYRKKRSRAPLSRLRRSAE